MKPTTLSLSRHKPNFDDPRVKARIGAVLDFCKPLLLQKKARPIASLALTKAFGNQKNSLAAYLRHKLLQQEGTYKAGHHSFSYSVKREGYAELEAIIGRAPRGDAELAVELYGAIAEGTAVPEYTEPTAGARRYHPVQNLPRALRGQLFRGWIDYDIEAAAPTLVYQEACRVHRELYGAERHAIAAPFPSVARLVRDRTEVREHVSKLIDLPLAAAKEILAALFFGARMVPNSKVAVFRILGCDHLRLAALKRDEFVSSFSREAKRMWDLLLLDENRRNGLATLMGGPVVPKPATKGKQRSSIYFRLERKVIDVIDNALRSEGVRLVLIHDGFMSQSPVDTGWLEAEVRQKTGFEIRLSEKKLGGSIEMTEEESESVPDEFGDGGELD